MMKYPWAVVGQKVVRVSVGAWETSKRWWVFSWFAVGPGPANGQTEEIAQVFSQEWPPTGTIETFITLKGRNPTTGYIITGFKPVESQHRASDIALFEPFLKTNPQKIIIDNWEGAS